MWVAERFPNLEMLLAFLNERAIPAERCKVVAVPGPAGAERWHLLYEPDDAGERRPALVAVAEAEAPAPDEAIASAEAIIADAQRDEPPDPDEG